MNETDFRRELIKSTWGRGDAFAWAVEPGKGGHNGVPDMGLASDGMEYLIECKVRERAGRIMVRPSQRVFLHNLASFGGVFPLVAVLEADHNYWSLFDSELIDGKLCLTKWIARARGDWDITRAVEEIRYGDSKRCDPLRLSPDRVDATESLSV